MQYRTEIHVAPDRYVCLQLPDYIPPGRATVVVSITAPADDGADEPRNDAEGDGVEWWDEFDSEDDPRRR